MNFGLMIISLVFPNSPGAGLMLNPSSYDKSAFFDFFL